MPDSFEPYHDMKVRDDYIPDELFSEFISHMPQVCVELVLQTNAGILVAKRRSTPRIWFWPGSRLFKGENLQEAAHRVAAEDLGIEVQIIEQLGVYTHFWEESNVQGSPSRHTANVVHHVTPSEEGFEIELDDQHDDYRFLTEIEPGLHEYVRQYLLDHELLRE